MVELFVPGRLCLLGEHSDWAGELRAADPTIAPGACILTGTDQGIAARAEAAPDFELLSRLPDGSVRGPFRAPMDPAALRAAASASEFFSYATGVVAEIASRYRTSGVRLTMTNMDLPIARGLSSSAAVCVLTARAFNRVYGLGLSTHDEMEIAYRGELSIGSQCGRMDQACAFGRRVVVMAFDGAKMTAELLPSGGRFDLLIVDLLHEKNTRRILADLHATHRATSDERCAVLRLALGEQNLALIARARAALAGGDAVALGQLMSEAQALFDRAVAPTCPEELAAPRLHALLDDETVRGSTWGGKGVGSQGDGAAQLVCRGAVEREALARYLTAQRGLRCLSLTIGKG